MIDGDQTINNVKTFANPPKCDQQPASDDDLINLQWTRHYIAEVGDPILEKVETLEKDMEGTIKNASANNFTEQLLNGVLKFMGVSSANDTRSITFYDKFNRHLYT